MVSHGNIPRPLQELCSGAKEVVNLPHAPVLSLSVFKISLLSLPSTTTYDISALRGVPHPPNPTRQSTGKLLPSLHPWTVARHSLPRHTKALLLSTRRWFLLLTPWQFFRGCLRIIEVIACTGLRSRPGMISSCIELSGSQSDTSMD